MNTDEKKTRTLNGTLMMPLTVGTKAVILHQGQVTLTTPVVAIHRLAENEVRFETKNTHYQLLTGPFHQPDVRPVPVAMAA